MPAKPQMLELCIKGTHSQTEDAVLRDCHLAASPRNCKNASQRQRLVSISLQETRGAPKRERSGLVEPDLLVLLSDGAGIEGLLL